MPHSNSEESQAFSQLDEKIQRWVWDQGWTDLRDAQEQAIPPILAGDTDVIIAAATATGKTEAAFLPICSKLLTEENQNACVIYLSPLKALINDQFSRMEQLCERLDIPVHPWHGDISASKKTKFQKKPTGILLITPESLESLFVRHGTAIPQIFDKLLYVVVDELHSFIGSERGQQLQSLLQRIEFCVGRKVPRIGLSATIGDMTLASQFLRPKGNAEVELIVSTATGQELQLLIRGYLQKPPTLMSLEENQEVTLGNGSLLAIGENLFQTLRGKSNLVFANSRAQVEFFADFLRRMCEENQLPNEFWPHHGNLSKELREAAEGAIKDKSRPVSIVCTSTLEMGIDIGSVSSVAQVGVPPSVASMRQRLGRSGRRGEPAVLRVYIRAAELDKNSSLWNDLRDNLVQTISMVRLLLGNWYEPPPSGGLHLSTLAQQLLSLIAQYGGVTATQAYHCLCREGAFPLISQQMFVDFLRSLGRQDLIMQASNGLLLHGRLGERIVNHYSFYAAFTTPEEYRLVSGDRTLGSLPIHCPLKEGSLLIFGGRRWIVLEVDPRGKVITLKPSKGGGLPTFDFQPTSSVHDRIRQEMFAVYSESSTPIYLDSQAKQMLAEARVNFQRYGLSEKRILQQGDTAQLLFWRGDRVLDTLVAMLEAKGLDAGNGGISVSVSKTSADEVRNCLAVLLQEGLPDTYELARSVDYKAVEKYDYFLTDELLSADYAASRFDAEGAMKAIKEILGLGDEE